VLTVRAKATAGGILNQYTFLPSLSLAYAYTFAQDNPTRSVSFFVITFESKYLPFAMLFMAFVMDGPDAALGQLMGLLAALGCAAPPRPCTTCPYPLFCTLPGAAPNQRFTISGVRM